MELSREIILDLIKERTAASKENSPTDAVLAIKEAECFLSSGLGIAVHILLGHTQCQAKEPSRCAAISQLEVWTIKVIGEGMPQQDDLNKSMQMPPMLLKQAIRSQLYFSPIKSWFSTIEQKKTGFSCLYKISTSSHFNCDESLIGEHRFPLCRLENNSKTLLQVHVRWLKKDGFPSEVPDCPSRRIDDEHWLLPTLTSPKSQVEYRLSHRKKSLSRHNSKESIESKDLKVGVKLQTRTLQRKLSNHLVNQSLEKYPPGTKVEAQTLQEKHSHVNRALPMCFPSAFHPSTRLPLNSSPAPIKRIPLRPTLALESPACSSSSGSESDQASSLEKESPLLEDKPFIPRRRRVPSGLLCNFEESALNGRLEPANTVEGFKLKIAISGMFSQLSLPVTTFYFKSISDNEIPSLYLGRCDLAKMNRKALQIPKQCTVQAVLFNPQGSVVKIFLVNVDVSDMPARSKTFVRQRTVSLQEEVKTGSTKKPNTTNETGPIQGNGPNKSVLKFLIHLRLKSDSKSRVFLHSDIKMLLSNKGNDLEGLEVISTKLDSFTQMPQEPKYSPVK